MTQACVYCGSEFGDGYCLESPDGCCRMDEVVRDGEEEDPDREEEKDFIWCGICCDHIRKSELRRWTGDDQLHYLCPGCDSDLLPVELME